jgi:protein gp37
MRSADWRKLHWIIVGGESGPRARPMHPQWARTIRDDCRKHKVPFFFKQVGSWSWSLPERRTQRSAGLMRDGRIVDLGTKDSQPITYGSKKVGGRRLDCHMHEEMPVGFTGTPKKRS